MLEDAGIEPRTVAITALAVRGSNHSARSHPLSARSHPHSARSVNLPVPEIIDTVFVKTSPKRSFSMTEYERFGLVFLENAGL